MLDALDESHGIFFIIKTTTSDSAILMDDIVPQWHNGTGFGHPLC